MTDTELHPDLAALAFLLGTWAGRGRGMYPTIEPFEYTEIATYGHVGKPFLSYQQRTKDAATGSPLHSESGYLRPVGDRAVELVLSQPSGIVEIHQGVVDGTAIVCTSATVLTTPTAKQVDAVVRRIGVDGALMTYSLDMAAVGQDLQLHLDAELRREG